MKVIPKTQSRTRKSQTTDKPRHPSKSFKAIMADTTRTMPKYKRLFSNFIHSRTVWTISDLLSRTIARPNALFFGALLSFIFTTGVYLVSKNLGYSLSGSESISAFVVGWTIGIGFDILSSLRKRK